MNIELLNKIIMELEKINPRKAAKLEKLLDEYETVQHPSLQMDNKKKINNMVYNLFANYLSKSSRDQLYSLGNTIAEDCYQIEQRENNGWYINSEGAKRYITENGEFVAKSVVPREYGKGFYIPEEPPKTEEERMNKEAAIDFYNKYAAKLGFIANLMDQKEELITFDYEIKSPKIPREFMELLIKYIGFSRVEQERKPKIQVTK